MKQLKFNHDKNILPNIDDIWKDEEDRRNNYFKRLGNYVGYDNKECIKCGRVRVNVFDNGNKVCEKCGIDQKTGEGYFNEYGSWLEYDV